MSAKSDFIRAIVEEGITAARKYFGTGIEKEIAETAAGKKRIDKAKDTFKNNRAVAAKEKKQSKGTQKGVRFKKKYKVQEGAALDAETGRSVSAARSVDRGEAGKVTRGRKSMNNFAADQAQASPGMRARSTQDDKAYKEIMAAREAGDTKKEKKLRKKQSDKLDKRQKSDEKSTRRSQLKGAQTRSGKKKPVDNYGEALKEARLYGVVESEYTKGLTPPQMAQVEKAARSAKKSQSRRRGEAISEEKRLQSGRTKPGESAVGPRKGTRGMRTRSEESQLKGMISGNRRGSITGKLKEETEEALLKRMRDNKKKMNKGGKVTKRATGAHDYRMNKGGLLLSSVDNRKKK